MIDPVLQQQGTQRGKFLHYVIQMFIQFMNTEQNEEGDWNTMAEHFQSHLSQEVGREIPKNEMILILLMCANLIEAINDDIAEGFRQMLTWYVVNEYLPHSPSDLVNLRMAFNDIMPDDLINFTDNHADDCNDWVEHLDGASCQNELIALEVKKSHYLANDGITDELRDEIAEHYGIERPEEPEMDHVMERLMEMFGGN